MANTKILVTQIKFKNTKKMTNTEKGTEMKLALM